MTGSIEATAIAAPELRDDLVCLRPWPSIDPMQLRDAVHESLDTVGRWQPWCHRGYELEEALAWIEYSRDGWSSDTDFSLAVCDALTGDLMGGIGLNHLNRLHRSANMGYWLRQSRQGRGMATTAGVLMARFGFENMQLIRIEIVAEPDNLPSRRVAEKLGARLESISRHRLWIHDQPKDAAVYALLSDDLQPTTV